MNTEQVTGERRKHTARRKPPWLNRRFPREAYLLSIAFLFFLCSSLLLAANDKDHKKHFGLIFGTVWGADNRGMPGVKIEVYPVGQKRPHWKTVSGARGEFSQVVPPGPGDYRVTGEIEVVPIIDGVRQKKKKLRAEKTIHIMGEEREDVGLHMEEDEPQSHR